MSQSVSAPDASRKVVKLAASMCVSLKAMRHNSELAAKASIVQVVSKTILVLLIDESILIGHLECKRRSAVLALAFETSPFQFGSWLTVQLVWLIHAAAYGKASPSLKPSSPTI